MDSENKRFLVFAQHKKTNKRFYYYHSDQYPAFVGAKEMGTVFYGFEQLESNLDNIHKTYDLFFDREQDDYELRIQETIILAMENNHNFKDYIEYESKHYDELERG